ncbi:MAG: hypothetical protein HOP23_07790 [Methylococcaceae bacterium]|nr:hypothetical protein [Methylococcaceae bacterium]
MKVKSNVRAGGVNSGGINSKSNSKKGLSPDSSVDVVVPVSRCAGI